MASEHVPHRPRYARGVRNITIEVLVIAPSQRYPLLIHDQRSRSLGGGNGLQRQHEERIRRDIKNGTGSHS